MRVCDTNVLLKREMWTGCVRRRWRVEGGRWKVEGER